MANHIPKETDSADKAEDFDFFSKIESTLVGTMDFTGRFLYTVYLLTFRPSRLYCHYYRHEFTRPISRPITFLSLTAFIWITAQRRILDMRSTESAGIRDMIESTSIFGLVESVFPIVVFVYIMGSGLSWLMDKDKKKVVVDTVFYSTGIVFFIHGTIGSLMIALGGLTFLFGNSWGAVFVVVLSPVVLYSLFLPGIVLLPFFRKLWGKKDGKSHTLRTVGTACVGILIFYTASIIGLALDIAEHTGFFAGPPSRVALLLENSNAEGTDGDTVSIDFIVMNESQEYYFLQRRNSLLVVGWLDNPGIDETWKELEAQPIEIVSWEAGDSSVLAVAPGEKKWLTAKLNIVPDLRDLLGDSERGTVGTAEVQFSTVRHGVIVASARIDDGEQGFTLYRNLLFD